MTTPTLVHASDLAFRVLFSLVFIVAGLGHFGQHDVMLARMQDSPWFAFVSGFGSPSLMLYASGVSLFAGGVALLLGIQTRWAALQMSGPIPSPSMNGMIGWLGTSSLPSSSVMAWPSEGGVRNS